MLANINSAYILKMLFEHISEILSLKLIRYNKILQEKLDFNIFKYMEKSGRYIIYEQGKRRGKEYDSYSDALLYEGEYLNELKNGKGKEYYPDGKLKFIGEYLNGKRNGEGREYDNGGLIFEGNYINGIKDGFGKEFYSKGISIFNNNNINELLSNNKLKFYGLYKNGKKWCGLGFDTSNIILYELKNGKGSVKEYNEHKVLLFEGEYANGEKNGLGKEYNNQGMSIFKGVFSNGKKWNGIIEDIYIPDTKYEINNGEGFLIEYDNIKNIIFEGAFRNGERNGKGKEYTDLLKFGRKGVLFDDTRYELSNLLFEGEYLNNERNGEGKEYENDILKFKGNYLNGEKNGYGEEYDKNGKILFKGEFVKGHKKEGKEFINEKLEFEGKYLFDKKFDGNGFDEKGKVIYTLKKGNGKVKEYKNGNLIFEGEYLMGKRSGKGKEFDELFGRVIYEGEYLDGKRKLDVK